MPSVKFGRKPVATSIRDRVEPFLADDDDGRELTLKLKDDAPDAIVQRVQEEAADTRQAEAQKAGQAELTDRERKEIDFTKDGVNVPFARSVKGIAENKGVEDWIQFADFTLGVDENRRQLADAARQGGGDRGRGQTAEQRGLQKTQQAKRRRREQAESAKDPAFRGDAEAAGFLREEQRFEEDLFDLSLRGAAPSGRDYERLEEAHSERSERAQRVDERRSATVTPDPLTWAQNPAQYDYVGIDTVDPEELHSERSLEARSVDERRSAPIADSREQWAQNTDTYDWPGVDTKQRPTRAETVAVAEEMRDARMASTMEYEPMSAEDDVASQALAADVSISPEEATRGVGAVGRNALGGFNSTVQGETAPTQPIDERPPDFERGEDPFDMSDDNSADGMLVDDRDQQASLDVGLGANTTADREGEIAGSADFADRRDELQPDNTTGMQSGLFEEEESVGDGQADLFGESASTSSGGEYLR